MIMIMLTMIALQHSLEVYSGKDKVVTYELEKLRNSELESFETKREKDGITTSEKWQGINLKKWLQENKYIGFKGIRFESTDNYMVRFKKSELDSMPGFIALRRGDKWLNVKEVRIIIPTLRDMYWVRGLERIYLEDFSPLSPPKQIFIWDAVTSKLALKTNQEPLTNVSGYLFDDILKDIFHAQEGTVILVARDGLKSSLDFPQHLKGALVKVTEDGTLNLKSAIIPSGMWLKDLVYMQCGSIALIKYDFLYLLPTLYKTLEWTELTPSDKVNKVTGKKTEVLLESLYQPGAIPFTTDEWIELP